MTSHVTTIEIASVGRGFQEISAELQRAVIQSNVAVGLCHVFLRHTSASLLITENADPDVRRDLETFISRLAPDGDPSYVHTMEGPDDMPAHIKNVLIGPSLTIPITDGRLALGTWQSIYLCEHRDDGGPRRVVATLQGRW